MIRYEEQGYKELLLLRESGFGEFLQEFQLALSNSKWACPYISPLSLCVSSF